jgi:hypothetical protein
MLVHLALISRGAPRGMEFFEIKKKNQWRLFVINVEKKEKRNQTYYNPLFVMNGKYNFRK